MSTKKTTTKIVETVETPEVVTAPTPSLLSAIKTATKPVEIKLDDQHTLVVSYRYTDVTPSWVEKCMGGESSLVDCIMDVAESWSINGQQDKLSKEALEEVGVVVQRLILDALFFDSLPGMKALLDQENASTTA